jgi:NADPH:quinone reductase-like Zn-dependent oxidoreductase
MRAAAITGYGGLENLAVIDVAAPAPAAGEVLVEIAYSGLNRADLFIRQGLTGPGVRQPRGLPHVLGVDGAGTVAALGPGTRPGVCVGDRVAVFPALSCGTCRHCRRGLTSRCAGYGLLGEDEWGLQRELIAIPAEKVLRIADDLPLADAAAVPGAYTTAWTMVVTNGAIRPGERLLAVGAAGGVSIAAMQIAAHAGAEIWATTRDAGKAKICGASGGDRPDISIRELYQRNRRIIGSPFGGWNDFRDVYAFLARSGVRPIIDRILPLEQISDAHRLMEEQQHIGKLLLRCSGPVR